MSLWILPNTIGDVATTLTESGMTIASGYDRTHIINGSRSSHCRWQPASGSQQIRYLLPTNYTPTHMVIARADWLCTQNTMRVKGFQRSSGGVWSGISGADYNPLAAANLMGPRSQDLAFAITPSEFTGFGLEADTISGSEALQISKLFVSVGFQFNVEPSFRPAWEPIPKSTTYDMRSPLYGTFPLEVEAVLEMRFQGVTTAKVLAFKALPRILNWPFFLFDDSGVIWSWKLEHVLLQSYEINTTDADYHDITLKFLRLKQYE